MLTVFNATDLVTIIFLVFLEGLLSLDNALVLAMVVRHLPVQDQKKALTYGIWGAFAFRFIALFWLTHLMALKWVKIAGGIYLIWTAIREALAEDDVDEEDLRPTRKWLNLWRIILVVEGLDIAFSVDSILAAVSVSQNYFVVLTGGILGIIMMRFAARLFVILMEKFPRLENTAFLLVATIGVKLAAEGLFPNMDFHNSHAPYGWLFAFSMIGAIIYGLTKSEPQLVAHS